MRVLQTLLATASLVFCLAGFSSVPEALESQLGLKLVPTTIDVPAIAIDEIQRPVPELARF